MGKVIRIALISDIHCHKKRSRIPQSSFLLTNTPNNPVKQNPLASLYELIDENHIETDLLLVPGDFCDQMDEDGFNYAWSEITRVADKLKAKVIIPTIGNHDVNSRQAGKTDVFRFAKNMDRDFPFEKVEESQKFWSDGFLIKEFPKLNLRILVINSSHHHYSLPEAQRGNLDDVQREKIEEQLNKLTPRPYQIAISHHHPIPHEDRLGGSSDVMVNGSLLMDILVKHGFKYYVHGHKHDIRLKYSNHGSDSIMVFACGSFSRHPYPSLSGVLNTFHILNIETDSIKDCLNQGIIETYFFAIGTGFQAIDTNTFPHKAGFGYLQPVDILAQKIENWLKKSKKNNKLKTIVKNKQEIHKSLPELKYLTPEQLKFFEEACAKKSIKFLYSSDHKLENVSLNF
jgi:hypothetical protein